MTKNVEMPLTEHLEELRLRVAHCLIVLFGCLVVCLIDQEFYMSIVLLPHHHAMEILNLPATIQVLRYEESFFAHLKVSVIIALILSMPFSLYQGWMFVAIGLYPDEKNYVQSFFPFTLFFFMLGVLFGYFLLIPLGLQFLANYGGATVHVGFTLSSYISLFFVLTFVCGVIFELPLIMLFLAKINVFNTSFYLQNWRYSILTAFVIAALFTPPDIVTQILLAFPMILLYFSGVLLCRISERMPLIEEYIKD